MKYLYSISLNDTTYLDLHDIIISGSNHEFKVTVQVSIRIIETTEFDEISERVISSEFITMLDTEEDVQSWLLASYTDKVTQIRNFLLERYS